MNYGTIVALDDVIHQRTRLAIVATLVELRRLEYTALRDELGVTAGNLSRHLKKLQDAGYIDIKRGYEGNRPQMWIAVTPSGSEAYTVELAALRELFAAAPQDRPTKDRAKSAPTARGPRPTQLRPSVAGS